MNCRWIPFTRLSIIFILAMVLSGGVLTYFSINNISNLKELTEKRILEEQQELSVRFSNALQGHLEQLTSNLLYDAHYEIARNESLIQFAVVYDFIKQFFLLEESEEFIFPYFTGIYNDVTRPELSAEFAATYKQGERAEFAENDPSKAVEYYKSCLDLSIGAADSASALNALGRVLVKSGEIEQATGYYIAVVHDYPTLSDRNGFPYAYYAISNLVNHTRDDNRDQILLAVENCLTGMERGFVPLNYQSGELLDLLGEWANEYMVNDSSGFLQMDRSIRNLDSQLQFLEQYGYELKSIIHEGNSRIQHQDKNSILVESSSSGEDPQFYLFKYSPPYASGFLVDQTSFFNTLTNALSQEDLEFRYTFDLFHQDSLSLTLNNLLYSFHLNPFFPDKVVQIYPQNEDLINDLVKRKSWIYGMATFLLLVAMLLGIILTQRDITREKNLANLRSDFISNVTHELKTPLTSIRMYAESMIMRRVKSGTDQFKYLSVIVNESERLKRMINNILDFSKMEKTRQEYHPVESNLSEILDSAILDMSYWLEKYRLTLKQDIQPDITAKVDPEKIYQAFTNLLSNAIKYSGESKNIFVRLYQNHDVVVTEVEDQGIGISNEDQLKIFDEFFRVENHKSGNITGTGLGLTVVKEIVEAHHGQVKVESEVGIGSKFSVILYQHSAHEFHTDH